MSSPDHEAFLPVNDITQNANPDSVISSFTAVESGLQNRSSVVGDRATPNNLHHSVIFEEKPSVSVVLSHHTYGSPASSPKYSVSVLRRTEEQLQLSPHHLPSFSSSGRISEGISPVVEPSQPSLLPPAASLGNLRGWPAGFRAGGPSEASTQLPQVQSLAIPNSQLYFGQSSQNWQTNLSSRSYSPVTGISRFPSAVQLISPGSPSTSWNCPDTASSLHGVPGGSQESWASIPGIQYHSQILRQNPSHHPSELYRPYSNVVDGNNVQVLNFPNPPQILRDPVSGSSSVIVNQNSTFQNFPVSDPLNSSSTLTIKPLVKMTDKSPRPKRKPKMPPYLMDSTGNYEVNLGGRKSRGRSTEGSASNDAPRDLSEESVSIEVEKVKAKKRSKSRPQAKIPPPPPAYSLRHKGPLTFIEGEKIEASDNTNTWYKARIVAVDKDSGHAYIHFEGWNTRYDEWIPMNSRRLRPLTAEKFSEHQERYNIGDYVIARWSTGLQKAGIVTEIQQDPERYVILYHEGSVKSVTNKGMRRMSPVLREKHAAELEQLRVLALTDPRLQHDGQPQNQPLIHNLLTAANEPPVQLHGEIEIASGEQKPDQLDTSQMVVLPDVVPSVAVIADKKVKSSKKKSMVDMPDLYSKPKRQPKKPSKFDDSVLDNGRKKRKKKEIAPVAPGNVLPNLPFGDTVAIDQPEIKPSAIVPAVPINTSPGVIVEVRSTVVVSQQNVSEAVLELKSPPVTVHQTVRKPESSISSTSENVNTESVLKSMLKSDHSQPSTSNVESGRSPIKHSDAAHDTARPVLPANDIFHPEDQSKSGVKKSHSKAVSKTVAPKELIIRIDHNEFKCTEEQCQKSFRKEKLLQDHLRHYHGISPEDEEERKVLVAGRKSRKSSLDIVGAEMPSTPASPCPNPIGDYEGSVYDVEIDPFQIPDPLPETPVDLQFLNSYKEWAEFPGAISDSLLGGQNLPPFPFLSGGGPRSKRDRKNHRRWKKDSMGSFYDVEQESAKNRSRGRKTGESESEDILQYIQNDHELVHCRCGYELENGFMVQCELCATWQHGHCYQIESKDDVPKYYTCDFCRSPSRVRFSQRYSCHDLQFMSTGKLPVFPPLLEDEDLALPLYPAPPSNLSAANKVAYTQLAADTGYCNDQLKTLRRIGRALRSAEEVHLKNEILLQNMCATQAERIKLNNAVNSVPDELIESLNIRDILEDLEFSVNDGDDISTGTGKDVETGAKTSTVPVYTAPLIPCPADASQTVDGGSAIEVERLEKITESDMKIEAAEKRDMMQLEVDVPVASTSASVNQPETAEKNVDENANQLRGNNGVEEPLQMSAPVFPEIDEDIMELCLQGDFPAVLKALHNREDSLGVYLTELECRLLEMEKACDARYGTQFASTPHLAAQDCDSLREKAYQQQSDLRNMQRLGYVVGVQPREKAGARPMPGPLPIPEPLTVTQETRPPLPVKIRLSNGTSNRKPKPSKSKREKKLKETHANLAETDKSALESPLAQSISQPS